MDAQLACTEFAGALAGLPCAGATFRLAAHARRLTAGVTLSVSGRPGVGVSTVVRALTLAGFVVPGNDGDPGDVRLRVIAEVAKPEDHAALRAAEGPALVVFAKADLCGFDGDGPLANARLRCAELGARTGVSTRPLIGPLAVAGLDPAVLDDAMLAGLRTLVSVPADLSSVDAFVSGPHDIPVDVRARLLERLDLFGIARAVLELRAEPQPDAAALRRALRAASGIDAVCRDLELMVAEARYRRLLMVVADLEAMAGVDAAVAALLDDERTVTARMAAATAVLQTAGMSVGAPGLSEALRWQTYGEGPVTALHRACAAELTRGSLRMVALR